MSSAIISLLISMISIQSGASAAKGLFPRVGPIGSTLLRVTLAAILLLLLWPPQKGQVSRRNLTAIARYGASLGCMNLCFYLALERIPLGIAVALEFIGPLSVGLFASRSFLDFIWVFFASAGIILIAPRSTMDSMPLSGLVVEKLNLIGVAFALGAALFWALYIIFAQKIDKSVDSKRTTSLGMLFATLVILPIGVLYADLTLIRLEILPLALVVALLSSVIPYSLEMGALQKLPPQTFGILMSLEPVVASFCGLLFLNEHLTFMQWAGIVLIMGASLGSTLKVIRMRS